ncbi:MAG: lipopolysaccharide transport periplasmic protein LptA [Methylococcales bacterium]|nr:lipopolysaccharide transport periplasmic protein LptA [Methylococcales bacterium]
MNLIKVFIFSVLLGGSHWAMALESDSEQPVYIDSNTASYNNKTGTSIYTGDVVTDQGSLHITSDKLVVYTQDGAIDKMVFTGKPAKFKQLPGVGKEEIHGEGLTGEYYPDENKLILIEEAVVSQGNNRSASRLIIYDSKNSLIKAGEKTSDARRVHSVFKPKAKKKEEANTSVSNRTCLPSPDGEGRDEGDIKCKNSGTINK